MTRLPLTSIVLVALVLGSCGSGAIVEDVVLVSRVGPDLEVLGCQGSGTEFDCVVQVERVTMHSADGRTAVSESSQFIWTTEANTFRAEVQCAGASYSPTGGSTSWTGSEGEDVTDLHWNDIYGANTAVRVRPRDPQVPAWVFVFEDGGRVELYPDAGLRLEAEDCYDESGEWRGVGGSFSDKRGPYRYTNDNLQSELVLMPS